MSTSISPKPKGHVKKGDFLKELSRKSSELDNFVRIIYDSKENFEEYKSQMEDLKEDPFQVLQDGRKRFVIPLEPGSTRRPIQELEQDNILDIVDSLEEAMEYFRSIKHNFGPINHDPKEVEPGNFHQEQYYVVPMVLDREDGSGRGPILLDLEREYEGPKIHMFPDSNIQIDKSLLECFKNMGSEEAIVYDPIGIVKTESKPGGIRKKFKNGLPDQFFRGQKSLEKRCENMTDTVEAEVTRFYDLILKYFASENESLQKLVNQNPDSDPKNIAAMFLADRNQGEDYKKMVIKDIKNYRSGNKENNVADRVLASLCFGLNLIDSYNKSIVISKDSDLKCYFDLMYNEILPRFMADSAMDQMRKRNPSMLKMPNVEKNLVVAAKEHIATAKDVCYETSTVGILYNPNEKRFHTYDVAKPFVDFFRNVTGYRIAKTQVLEGMLLTGKKARRVMYELMGK
ncbi:hypothetical protein GF345_03990 [Candidatus Woesearchaeota archaeon]|nr:hypothetical protein [Candidatus Woesearchaeota archaeon]